MTKQKKNIRIILNTLLCVCCVVLTALGIWHMRKVLYAQAKQDGEARVVKVSGDMQRVLENSKITLLRFAADVEVYAATNASQEEIKIYLRNQSNIFRDQSENTLINAYICTDDWILISESPLPADYELDRRQWYRDTLKYGIDNIHISAPYMDAFTDQMCFTSSMLLSDGKTIVALDYNLSKIQSSVEQMSRESDGEALIINRNGLVVGYTDSSFIGKELSDVLPEYNGLYERFTADESDSAVLNSLIRGKECTSFCNRSGEWLFIYTVDDNTLYKDAKKVIMLDSIPRVSFMACILFLLFELRKMGTIVIPEMKEEETEGEKAHAKKKNSASEDITGFTKKSRNGIMTIMALTVTVAVAFSGIVLVNWGSDRMAREIDSYSYQLERWMNTQLTTLNMFVDTIAANPSVLDEYEPAVEYLNEIVKNYPEISAAYIARPGNEHEMTMNNGWVPNADYIVAERQWYKDTESSENGMSVSSPYLDARTGLYCVTFSRIVLNSHTGERIGIFALDFYIGNLTGIMEKSYADDGYAFLVDNSDLIVNHPNAAYQITGDKSTHIAATVYSDIKNSSSIHFIRDYDGKYKACVSRTENVTGFSVFAVKDIESIYGMVFLAGGAFIVLLAVCIVLLYNLIVKMIEWQDDARQALIEEANRASTADRAKSSFLAQMSHEIRTPINAVLGMNEMILRESKEENILTYASNAYNSGNALLSIINDILDISKIEAGKLEITETDYDLYSLVNDCYHMTANRAEKKDLKFTVACDENLPSRLKGDMFHIRQIVVNFITNSIKYTDTGSVELSISGKEENGIFYLIFAVKDTGIGLKPESIEKLFTSFQRFDLQRNQTVEGTGLGLSICKQLAELMGGSVKAESVYGEGSVFTCTVPQKIVNRAGIGELHLDKPVQKAVANTMNKFSAPAARILVVDDVEMNIFVFKSFLKEHEMQIDSALSGAECLELARNNDYDIIFMDHMMPGMDGIETFERLHKDKCINDKTPVIMLTANAIYGEEEKYLSMGFASYLTKPIQSAKLDNMLLKFLPAEKIEYKEGTSQADETAAPEEKSEHSELFDMNTGLMYNGQNRDIYFTALKMYVTDSGKRRAVIEKLFGEENWKDYVTEVHALKSSSLMIGSEKLSADAKELEFAGKEGNYSLIKEKNAALLSLYEEVAELGKKLLIDEGLLKEEASGETAELLPDISAEELDSAIAQITAACDNFDDDEIVRLCDELSSRSFKGKNLDTLFGNVKMSAENFEYAEAAEKTAAAAAELKGSD